MSLDMALPAVNYELILIMLAICWVWFKGFYVPYETKHVGFLLYVADVGFEEVMRDNPRRMKAFRWTKEGGLEEIWL